MGGYVYFQLTSSKVLIFDWKYIIIQKNLVGRSLVACPNLDTTFVFHPIIETMWDRQKFNQKDKALEKNL